MTAPGDWDVFDTVQADNGVESTIYIHKPPDGKPYRYQVSFDGGHGHQIGGTNGMKASKALAYRIAQRGYLSTTHSEETA